jgi:glutamate N-acetyltransferase/amino-acid N-acetyltransferase
VRYLLTNTGNANAGTGEPGLAAAERTCAKLAELAGVDASQVLPYSTGVIGEPLPVEKIEGALQAALDDLSENNWEGRHRHHDHRHPAQGRQPPVPA